MSSQIIIPESLAELLNFAQEILLLVDQSSLNIVSANISACRQLGYKREELIGRPITEIECALADVFFWEEVRNGGNAEVTDVEGLYQCADGSTLTARKSVLRSQNFEGWLVVRAHNIAAEKHAEEELAHTASQLRATLEATADGILMLDRNGDIANMNRRFAELWSLPSELLLRHDDKRLFAFLKAQLKDDPENSEAHRESLAVLAPLGDGDDEQEHFSTLHLNDDRVFECKSRPARHAEQIIGRVISVTDVTERHHAELALISARDIADAASRAKGEFLAMMSHEIRTPMNGIIGMAQLLQMSDLPAEQREYVDTMRSSGEALMQIINDILDYSKIEARKLTLENTGFDLSAMLDDLRKLFSVQRHDNSPSFTITLSPEVPRNVRGDPVRLRQVLVNLIGNAFKFTKQGAISLNVSMNLNASAARQQQTELLFSVRDTGIGIPHDKLEHIFTPFEQADMSTTRRFGGTGLGLSICRMLCVMMGGKIGVNSEPGKGSEFWFTVTLALDLPSQHTVVSSAAASRLNEEDSLLIVEDNAVNQMVLTNLLRKLGARQIVSAVNGSEALARCAAQDFDLIFMDTRMPVMDGIEATRALRATGSTSYIVGVSADAMAEDRSNALESGMNDYITKPVSVDSLSGAIGRWHDSRPDKAD
ncbi:ATP-binding protein [Uliginosibacterium sp. H3]|uniref:histidine kinase n=1 Tax=Uliginosibacterium silvisoli TaxID=3114758 RepID=A0ABU6JYZ3_9RHOO|nr:ATP-binding protein [Uliginosibacterium sp. H3]